MEKDTFYLYCVAGICAGATILLLLFSVPAAAVFLLIACALAVWAGIRQESARRAAVKRAQDAEEKLKKEQAQSAKDLEQTKKWAKDQVTNFHSKISHSLRIPISVIQGYAELLQGNLITDESVRKEYLKKICERVGYVNDILGQLLAEARAQADIPGLVWEKLDLVKLVGKAADDMKAAAEKRGISIRFTSSVPDAVILGDGVQLTRVFYNIMENSMKYMQKAGNIDIMLAKPDEDHVFLAFRDDGVGMDETEAQKIFDLNYQGSNAREGSGMGLYLAKATALAHNGEIYAKSSPGAGMSIFLMLPSKQDFVKKEEEKL